MRIALPIAAAALMGVFILNTQRNSVDQAFLDDFEDLSASAEELRVAGPTYTGVDDMGEPYEITARSALQRPGGGDVLELDSPRAVQGGEDNLSIVTANKGLYRSEAHILELQDSVAFEHVVGGQSYMLRTPMATVAIKNEIVTSDSGVDGEGEDGSRLAAARMTAYRGEGRVVFEGGVSMRIYPKTKKDQADNGNDGTLVHDGKSNPQ
jgi:lipopolysaccharide export system protein LptC